MKNLIILGNGFDLGKLKFATSYKDFFKYCEKKGLVSENIILKHIGDLDRDWSDIEKEITDIIFELLNCYDINISTEINKLGVFANGLENNPRDNSYNNIFFTSFCENNNINWYHEINIEEFIKYIKKSIDDLRIILHEYLVHKTDKYSIKAMSYFSSRDDIDFADSDFITFNYTQFIRSLNVHGTLIHPNLMAFNFNVGNIQNTYFVSKFINEIKKISKSSQIYDSVSNSDGQIAHNKISNTVYKKLIFIGHSLSEDDIGGNYSIITTGMFVHQKNITEVTFDCHIELIKDDKIKRTINNLFVHKIITDISSSTHKGADRIVVTNIYLDVTTSKVFVWDNINSEYIIGI